jgi:hypothetical protein
MRKVEGLTEPASCRFGIALATKNAIFARAACPMLPDEPAEVSGILVESATI